MNLKALLLLSCLLVVSTRAMTVGSCNKFSLDGQKCQECIEHFHLYEGVCYVDILGCQDYTFGNICHSCDNGYILVNNLCCDHNCLAKLFKRHNSATPTTTITKNHQIFTKILPFLSQHYLKSSLNNLVQIEQRDYIDVRRFVLLYEFPSGKFKMRRAIVDYVKESQEIVMVDWSRVENFGDWMEVGKEDVGVEGVGKVLEGVFGGVVEFSLVKKFKLTEIQQYEVVFQNTNEQMITYQTFYLKNTKKLLLQNHQKSLPEFMPSQSSIPQSQFQSQQTSNPYFAQALKQLKSDSRYRPSLHHALIKHKNRYINQYVFYVENQLEELQFFMIQNLGKGKGKGKGKGDVKVVDYLRREKERKNQFVSKVVEAIDTEAWKGKDGKFQEYKHNPSLSASENKVAELVHQTITHVKEEKSEQKRLSECGEIHCEDKDTASLPMESEQLSVVKEFRKRNPTLVSFELVETWSHTFKTFIEWTVLVRVEKDSKPTFIFFHALEFLDSKEVKFWGQVESQEPQLDSDGKYVLPNPQENVPERKVEEARTKINSKFPEVSELQSRKTILREFPESRRRFVVVLRHKTSEVRYVVLKDEKDMWVQEYETIEDNLEPVNSDIKKWLEVEHKLQVIIDQVHHGKQIDPEVSLTKIQPITLTDSISQSKQSLDSPKKTSEQAEQIKIIKEIRQKNENLKDFQIVKKIITPTEQGQRQTFLLKPIPQQNPNPQSSQSPQSPTYQYHTITKNSNTNELKYIGQQTKQSILVDEIGKPVQPETLIQLTKPKEQKEPVSHSNTDYVKFDILEKLEKVKDVQEVSQKFSSQIQKFVVGEVQGMQAWELKQTWANKYFKTFVQHVLLFVKGDSYKYVYVFEWTQKQKYTLEGTETTSKPSTNEYSEYINPNPQHEYPSENSEPLLKAITKQFPEVQQNEVNKVIERVFPEVKRYIVTLRTQTKKLEYVLHDRKGKLEVVQWDVIQDGLPVVDRKTQVIKEIVEEAIKKVKEEKSEQKRLGECGEIHCEDKDTASLPMESEQLSVVKEFRKRNPTLVSFELVETWSHTFKTFIEWTVLVRVEKDSKPTFIFFHALEFLDSKEVKFWGQVESQEPQLDSDGKYVLPNPQENVPERKVEEARTKINSKFPEVSELQSRKTILREFPESRRRFVVVLRHKTSEVRYVVLKDEKDMWVQEYETIEDNLESINDKVKAEVEFKNKLETVVDEIQQMKNIDKHVDLKKITEEIEIVKKPKEEAPEVKEVNEQSKVIKVAESPVLGKKTESTHSISDKDQKTIDRLNKLIKGKFSHHFSTHETEIFESNEPLTVIEQRFCHTADIVLVFEVSNTIYVLAFRASLTDNDNIDFLGKFSFPKEEQMTEHDIITRATAVRSEFDSQSAYSAIAAKHEEYKGLKAQSQDVVQLGDFLRISYVIKKDDYLNRFLISGSPAGQYEVIEECRLEKVKEVHTETKVIVTGETVMSTNDVDKVVKEDKAAKQVIEEIKHKVEELKESTPVNVQVTDYEKKTEYVVAFETKPTETEEKKTEEVSVVHDKVTHKNDIVAVEPVAVEKEEPVKEGEPAPVKVAQEHIPEEKFTVVTEQTPEVSSELHEAIKKISEEVRASEKIPEKEMQVKEVLIREHEEPTKTEKVQQVIENTKTGEQLLVTAIVNPETKKVVIEEIKPVEEQIVKELEPVQPQHQTKSVVEKTEPVVVKEVNEQSKVIKVAESPVLGKKTESTHSISDKDQKTIDRLNKLIKGKFSHHFSTHETEIFESNEPLTVIEQRFCHTADIVLVFEVSNTIYVLAFRASLTDNDNIDFLGKFSFPKEEQMTEQDIITRATAVRSEFDSQSAYSAIAAKHEEYKGLEAQSQEVVQLGDFLRISYVIKKDDYLNRFLISGSPAGQYEVIEECRLEKVKEVHTETKVIVTGETVMSTNDVDKVVKEDKAAKQVIEEIKHKVEELKESTPVNVQVTDYEKKTEYVVAFETKPTETEEKKTEEVSVVHDKVTHKNDIVAVEPVAVEKEEPANEGEPAPVKVAQEHIPEEKYTVVTEQTPEVSTELHEAIKKISEEVRASEKIPEKEMQVKEVLIREHEEPTKTEKVQQVIENTKTGEQLLVTAIVNPETKKVVIEDIKPVEEQIVKKLEPVEVTKQVPIEVSSEKPSEPKEEVVKISPQQVQQVLVEVQQQINKRQVKSEICDEISKQVDEKSKQETSEPQKPSVLVIAPSDIQSVIQSIKSDITISNAPIKQQKFTPPVTQTTEQVISYLQQQKPETEEAKIITKSTENYPNSVVTHIVEQTPSETIYATVVKTQQGNKLTQYEKVENSKETTLQAVVNEIDKEDKASYQPVDPQVNLMNKATQILAGQPTNQFEHKIDLSKPDEKIEEIVQAIRNQYPITSTGTVIAATETKISSSVNEVKVDFYVPTEDKTYKVEQAQVQVDTAKPDQTFTVTKFTEVINNGVPTGTILEQTNPTDVPNIINAAYGFEKLNLAVARKNQDIQKIQAEIQRRYPEFVAGQTVAEIQELELKSGKVNYIFRYKTAYFTIYWDSTIKRIIFLNEVSSVSRTEFTAVKDIQFFTQGLQYIIGLHPTEMKNYKTLSSGQSITGVNILFQVQFLSGNKKYRCIFQINKQTLDISEIQFIELIEISMRENNLKEMKILTQKYMRIQVGAYKTDRYLTMVDQYVRNRNPLLLDAKILAVSYKPQNLGFVYLIDYKLSDSRAVEYEIYIETFSQKYSQVSFKFVDFDTGFSTAQVDSTDMDKILKAISSKTSIALIEGQYKVANVQVKQIFFGLLFRILVTINNADYSAIATINSLSNEINLLSWKLQKSQTEACETQSTDQTQCLKCPVGYIVLDNKTCVREISGCEVYGDQKLTCNVCKIGYSIINNICTKDCGGFCGEVGFP